LVDTEPELAGVAAGFSPLGVVAGFVLELFEFVEGVVTGSVFVLVTGEGAVFGKVCLFSLHPGNRTIKTSRSKIEK
jgi:hypothetical protein